MHSKVMVLIWERWQRTRWAVIAACLLPLSGKLMYTIGFITPETAITVTKIFFFLSFILLTFVLIVGHCETRDVDLMFQKRIFRFPVRTTTLLYVYMGYGVAAVALQSLMLFGFESLFFDTINYRWTNLLTPETIYIVLQTLSWLGGLAGFLGLTLALTGVYVFHEYADTLNLYMAWNIQFTIIILLCGAVSFWCISAYRHGSWINGRQLLDSFLSMFRKRPSKRFASPMHAQIWFEMRQTGHLFPLITMCLIGLILGWMVGIRQQPSQFSLVVQVVFMATIIAALIAGFLAFTVYHRDHVSGALSFWLRLPITTRMLAVARLHAMARSLAHVLAILMMVALALAVYDWARGTLNIGALSPVKWALMYNSPFETVTMTCLGLIGFVLLYWTLLCLAPILLVCEVVVVLISWLIKSLIGDVAILWVSGTLIMGLTLGVLGAFDVARHRNLITTATLVISACMFPVAAVALWACPWWFGATKGLSNLNQLQIIHLVGMATLPFIPLVASPLLIDKLRHR